MAPIEIDGLPINSMVIFHGYVKYNQMVPGKSWKYMYLYVYIYMPPGALGVTWMVLSALAIFSFISASSFALNLLA